MPGLIGKKLGMTSIYDDNGKATACTIVEAGPCIVTQLKSEELDGYRSVQLGFGNKKEKNTCQSLKGHFNKSGSTSKEKVVEFRDFSSEFNDKLTLGRSITIDDIFSENDYLDVVGISKGKGFQGVVKRHGFSGVGQATHGQHNRLRAPGSIGACSFPSRVFKGLKMAGRTGGNRVKVTNLKVVKIYSQQNLVLIGGAVPGAKNSFLILER